MEAPKAIETLIIPPVAHQEKTTDVVLDKLARHSIIVRQGTTFLIVFSILAFYAAMYLIHMESVQRNIQSTVVKNAVR